MLQYVSPSSYYITEKFGVVFFPSKKKETFNIEVNQKTETITPTLFIIFVLLVLINIFITYHALKLACKSGFDMGNFLMAYYFSVPYILFKSFLSNK